MASGPYILMLGDDQAWRVYVPGTPGGWVDVPVPSDASPEVVATAVAQIHRTAGWQRQWLFSLPSSWCLCGQISTQNLPAKGRRHTLAYRLEEVLPLSAEQTYSAFIISGDAALGIATERARLEQWLEAFAGHEIEPWPVAPAALLAAQAIHVDSDSEHWLLWGRDDAMEVLHLSSQGLPTAWYTLPQQAADVRNWLAASQLSPGTQVVAIHIENSLVDLLKDARLSVNVRESPAFSQAVASAGRARGKPWVHFDIHALETGETLAPWLRRPVTAAMAGLVIFLLGLATAGFVRAARYDSQARRDDEQQTQIFQDLFPKAAPPQDVRSRLASEARRLGSAGTPDARTAQAPTHAQLRDLIDALPDEVRLHVTDIEIDPDKFSFEGEAKSREDVESVADALRHEGPFLPEPPSTSALTDKSVKFTLHGTIAAPGAARPKPEGEN